MTLDDLGYFDQQEPRSAEEQRELLAHLDECEPEPMEPEDLDENRFQDALIRARESFWATLGEHFREREAARLKAHEIMDADIIARFDIATEEAADYWLAGKEDEPTEETPT